MSLSNYDILLSPVVTEKSTLLSESNKVVFKVAIKSNKKQIKKSVEEIFKVKVKYKNNQRIKGKTTKFRKKKSKLKYLKHEKIENLSGLEISLVMSLSYGLDMYVIFL